MVPSKPFICTNVQLWPSLVLISQTSPNRRIQKGCKQIKQDFATTEEQAYCIDEFQICKNMRVRKSSVIALMTITLGNVKHEIYIYRHAHIDFLTSELLLITMTKATGEYK